MPCVDEQINSSSLQLQGDCPLRDGLVAQAVEGDSGGPGAHPSEATHFLGDVGQVASSLHAAVPHLPDTNPVFVDCLLPGICRGPSLDLAFGRIIPIASMRKSRQGVVWPKVTRAAERQE